MIFETFKKRKYALEYEKDAEIPESLIEELLYKAWEVTPSKNNFMPYSVHVLNQDCQQLKEQIFNLCKGNEITTDNIDEIQADKRHNIKLPAYANILSCSYLILFTQRLETDPNPVQKDLIENKGHVYEAVDPSSLHRIYGLTSFESGLFADVFSGLCIENNLDVSFTGCFPRNLDKWKEIEFVKYTPIMLMTVGKAKTYLQDTKKGFGKLDTRPDYSRIVNFIKN